MCYMDKLFMDGVHPDTDQDSENRRKDEFSATKELAEEMIKKLDDENGFLWLCLQEDSQYQDESDQ